MATKQQNSRDKDKDKKKLADNLRANLRRRKEVKRKDTDNVTKKE